MGKMLEALLHVQSIERQLAHVRGRLRAKENAVAAQKRRIEQLRENWNALHDRDLARRADADRFDMDLREKEEKVAKLRGSLNTARTNKEYAAILTQINTYKADNAKLEEDGLKIMQEADAVRAEANEVQTKVVAEEHRLEDVEKSNADEVAKLKGMLADLSARRAEAARAVASDKLAIFDRIAVNYDGEAMAEVEVHGNRAPYTYVCGGCYMSLTAEHANALRVKDEIRTCDNCGRILYLTSQDKALPK